MNDNDFVDRIRQGADAFLPELEELRDFMGPWIFKVKSALNQLTSESDQTKKRKLAEEADRLCHMACQVKEVIVRFGWSAHFRSHHCVDGNRKAPPLQQPQQPVS